MMDSYTEIKYKMHEYLLSTLHDTYMRKNRDYGDSATKAFKKYGLVSYLMRMEDKFGRLETLTKTKENGGQQQVLDESIEDTLLDIANYCVMAVMDLREAKEDRIEEAISVASIGQHTFSLPTSYPHSDKCYAYTCERKESTGS